MKVLIIEDENWLGEELAETLTQLDKSIEIVAILNSVAEAILFLENTPELDLIFSDIQLGDGLSFEIIQTGLVTVPVIFCTAYDEYMLEAFDSNGIAYILKPFSETTVQRALDKYNDLKKVLTHSLAAKYEHIMANYSTKKASTSIVIKYRNRIIPIAVEKIALCFIENGVTYVYTHAHRKFVHTETMDELQEKLSPLFFRVNRQYLVNKNAIKNAEELFSRKLKLQLIFPWDDEITVSKEKKRKLLNWLQ